MKLAKQVVIVVAFAALIGSTSLGTMLGGRARARSGAGADYPAVTAPPDLFFEKVREKDRDAAREFYKKYIDIKGMPVAAAAEVADLALQRTYDIVTHMLAGRPDVLKAMIDRGMYLVIIGKDQVYTDLPENRNARNPDYLNERVRGTGGLPTSFGEENLLSLPIDRYDDESIAVHEFCHTIDSTLSKIDPTWRDRKNAVYRNAVDKGLFKDTYAGSNSGEYWCEIAQAYFDCNRINNWNHGPIGMREQLKVYDPEGYELVRTTFNLSPDQDWRYAFLQKQPSVTPPPAKFNIDPYYTKFTWAREFTVLGREASDEAMLRANDTIRKMFAYRHDILKALIADGVKLVVLGPHEKISDLPEWKEVTRQKPVLSQAEGAENRAATVRQQVKGLDHGARFLDYSPHEIGSKAAISRGEPETKLLVVGQENVLANPKDPYATGCQVIRVFAKALYHVTGTRPVDPNWDNRRRDVQQYELRVQRMDMRFDEKLQAIYDSAMSKGLLKGTAAVHSRIEYWAEGVLAYFDAAGTGAPPNDAEHPITTREALKEYDPDLFALVDETMAYKGKVDWRYQR
jgi:alpha-glucosidase